MKTPILAFDDAGTRYDATDITFTASGADGAYVVSWVLSTDAPPDAETEVKEKSIALISEGSIVEADASVEAEMEDGARFTPAAAAFAFGMRLDVLDTLVQHYATLARKCPSWLVYEGIDTTAFEAALTTTILDGTLAAIKYPDAGDPSLEWKTQFLAGTGPAAECVDDTRTAGEAPGTTTRSVTLRAFHVEGEGSGAVTVEDDTAELVAALGQADPTLADAPPVVAATTTLTNTGTFKLYVSFKRWQPATESGSGTTDPKGSYVSLPVDTPVRVIDCGVSPAQYKALQGTIGSDGLVHWNRAAGGPESATDFVVNKSDFTTKVYFLLLDLPASPEFRFHDSVVYQGTSGTEDTTHQAWSWTDTIVITTPIALSNAWGTKGLKSMDGATSGTLEGLDTLVGTALGSASSPLTFPVGIPVHARFAYSKGSVKSDNLEGECPMPPGVPVRVVIGGSSPTTLATFYTDKQGQIDGTVNKWTAGSKGVELEIDLKIRDDATGLQPLEMTLAVDASTSGGAIDVTHTTVSHRYISTDVIDSAADKGWGLGPWNSTSRNELWKGRIGDVGAPQKFLLGERAVATPSAEDDLHTRSIVCGAIHVMRLARATYNWFDAVTESFDGSSAYPRMRTLMSTNLYDVATAYRVPFTLTVVKERITGQYGGTTYNLPAKNMILRLFHTPPASRPGTTERWNTCWSTETISHEMTHALMYIALGTTIADGSSGTIYSKFLGIHNAVKKANAMYDGQCFVTSEYTALFEGLATFAEGPFGGRLMWEVGDVDVVKRSDTEDEEEAMLSFQDSEAHMSGSRETPTPERPSTPTQPTSYARHSVYVEDFKYRANLTTGTAGDWFYPIDAAEFTTANGWILFDGTNTVDPQRPGLPGTRQRWFWFHALRSITSTDHYDRNPGQLFIMVIGSFLWYVLKNDKPAGVDAIVRDFDAPADVDTTAGTMSHDAYFDSAAPKFKVFTDSATTTQDWDVSQFLESGDSERARRLFRRIFWGPLLYLATPSNWEAIQYDFTEPFVQRWWTSQTVIDAIDTSGSHRFWPSANRFFDKLLSDYDALTSVPTYEATDRDRVKKWLNYMLLYRNP